MISRTSARGDTARGAKRLLWLLARAALPVCAAGSVLGLLRLRIGPYDESALLLGARLVGAGKSPYSDFYTNYGPLGYSLVAPFLSLGNPGLAYRVAQGAALLVFSALVFAVVRRTGRGRLLADALGAGCVVAFSTVMASANFLGFLFVAAALALTVIGETVRGRTARYLLAVVAGMMLALAALVRPAFGAYAGIGILTVKTLARRRRPATAPRDLSPALLLLAGAIVCFSILWTTLYAKLSLPVMFYSAVVLPGQLVRTGARFLSPNMAPAGAGPVVSFLFSAASSLALFGLTIVWCYAIPGRRPHRLALAATITGGLLPLLLRASRHPGRDSVLISIALLVLAILVLAATKEAVARSRLLRFAALCGITAATFHHYFWTRADRPHLLPVLSLATGAAAFCLPILRPVGRLILVALLLFEWQFVFSSRRAPYPILAAWRQASGPTPATGFAWPAEEFPVDAMRLPSPITSRNPPAASLRWPRARPERRGAPSSFSFSPPGSPIRSSTLTIREFRVRMSVRG